MSGQDRRSGGQKRVVKSILGSRHNERGRRESRDIFRDPGKKGMALTRRGEQPLTNFSGQVRPVARAAAETRAGR